MQKYEGYDKAEAFTGDYENLIPGGYICKILKVTTEPKDYGELLRIGFDIVEGEHKDFYKRQFERAKKANEGNNEEIKWRGMYYQTVKPDDLKYFKGFMTAIEGSNSGYKWNWDEKTLVGKLFGGIFGQEEYEIKQGRKAGEIGLSTKCLFVRTVEQVRTGGFKIPDVKRVTGASGHSSSNVGFAAQTENDDDLPF